MKVIDLIKVVKITINVQSFDSCNYRLTRKRRNQHPILLGRQIRNLPGQIIGLRVLQVPTPQLSEDMERYLSFVKPMTQMFAPKSGHKKEKKYVEPEEKPLGLA
jgi:hypothetical protein